MWNFFPNFSEASLTVQFPSVSLRMGWLSESRKGCEILLSQQTVILLVC